MMELWEALPPRVPHPFAMLHPCEKRKTMHRKKVTSAPAIFRNLHRPFGRILVFSSYLLIKQ
jgi:hypothetical protein